MIRHPVSSDQFHSAPLNSIRDGFGEMLVELGRKHWNVVTLTADLAGSLRMDQFAEAFPDRAFEVGVAEQNLIGMAAGMAKEGLIPFAGSFSAFSPGRTYDQIRVSVCYSNNAVKVVGGHAGLSVGPDGATHQMNADVAMIRALPNMEIVVPSDYFSARSLTAAIATRHSPAYIRLSRAKTRSLLGEGTVPFGEMVEFRPGSDLTIVAMGIMIDRALQLAYELEEDGLSVGVVGVYTLKPIDAHALQVIALQSKRIVTLEEHQQYGGLGSIVAEVLSQTRPTPLEIIGVADTFGESGSAEEVLNAYGFALPDLRERVLQFMARTQ